jgi:hypothetical protein
MYVCLAFSHMRACIVLGPCVGMLAAGAALVLTHDLITGGQGS